MISFIQINNPEVVVSYVKGAGIRRRCAGDIDVTLQQAKDSVDFDSNTYLDVDEDGKSLGMVSFLDHQDGTHSIHLCLRTAGKKTREVFSMALEYAKDTLGVTNLYAIFPKKSKACLKLSEEFGFEEAELNSYFYVKSLKLK